MEHARRQCSAALGRTEFISRTKRALPVAHARISVVKWPSGLLSACLLSFCKLCHVYIFDLNYLFFSCLIRPTCLSAIYYCLGYLKCHLFRCLFIFMAYPSSILNGSRQESRIKGAIFLSIV